MALLYAHTPTLILKVRPAASLSIFSRNCNFFCFKFIGKLFNQYHMLTYHTTGLTTTKSSSHSFFRNWVLVIESAVSEMSRKGVFTLKCANRYILEMALPITKLILKKKFNRNYPKNLEITLLTTLLTILQNQGNMLGNCEGITIFMQFCLFPTEWTEG